MCKNFIQILFLIFYTITLCVGQTTESMSWLEKLSNENGFLRDVRIPNRGFYGVRGKKDFEPQEIEKRALMGIPNQRERNFIDRNRLQDAVGNINTFVPKRAPYPGFFGVRGKKLLDYDISGDKRAPMGFLGVRGKKSTDDDYFDDNNIFYQNSQDDEDLLNDFEKRAPKGFFGMRGKKSPNNFELPNFQFR